MKRVLFICSQNKLRSPTAEAIFCERDDIEYMDPALVEILEARIPRYLGL